VIYPGFLNVWFEFPRRYGKVKERRNHHPKPLLTDIDFPACVNEVRSRPNRRARGTHGAYAVGADHAAGTVGEMQDVLGAKFHGGAIEVDAAVKQEDLGVNGEAAGGLWLGLDRYVAHTGLSLFWVG